MTKVAIFDMNETTLDLAEVRLAVNDVLDSTHGFTMWFQKLLQLAMTSAVTGAHQEFSVLAPSALRTIAASIEVELADDAVSRVGTALAAIAPYPDVVAGLESLRAAGWTTMPLTNSGSASVTAQLSRNKLDHLFDHVLSVDAVQRFKPQDTWMVACHDWDLAGARALGIHTAYVARPHMDYADAYPRPDVFVADFVELAETLTN